MNERKQDIIYIDLNSCFATIEQQARPMLRGRPVAITNRITPNSCIIAASYEAKALGIKVGMRRMEADTICKDVIYAETEPSKYIFVHEKFKAIMADYSADTAMKSIDEGVIDLGAAPEHIYRRSRAEIGHEIKQRLRDEIGDYMRCNVGIASNRFLAKLAGELHKPDGLDEITAENQRDIFATLKLQDLPGINVRMEARLNAVGIFTPLQLLDTDEETLVKMVCHSIDGTKWHKRLRGIEVDDTASDIKSIGRQYVLEHHNFSRADIEARILHLAEDVGYRLRSKNLYARGIYLWGANHETPPFHTSIILREAIHSDQDIQRVVRELFAKMATPTQIIGVTLYKLQSSPSDQLSLYQDEIQHQDAICSAIDQINFRFGARKIHSADTLNTEQVKTKIPFGSTRYLDRAIS